MRINGSTTLVTGAAGGIGVALVARLHAAGAQLVITGRRADALDSLAASVGGKAIVADLSSSADVARLATSSGPIDLLVANAALPASGDLLDYMPEQVEHAIAVNLTAPVMLARLLAPHMVASGRGHLAFVGSLSGKAATPAASLYTATKFGLRGFALALRQDLHGKGVGVSVIQPGFVRDAGMFAMTGEPTPSGVGTVSPDEVATAVLEAIEHDRGEVNIAPLTLRLRCALAVQFPRLAERLPQPADAGAIAQRIVEAQRPTR